MKHLMRLFKATYFKDIGWTWTAVDMSNALNVNLRLKPQMQLPSNLVCNVMEDFDP